MPWLKYSLLLSPLRLAKGSTAIELGVGSPVASRAIEVAAEGRGQNTQMNVEPATHRKRPINPSMYQSARDGRNPPPSVSLRTPSVHAPSRIAGRPTTAPIITACNTDDGHA